MSARRVATPQGRTEEPVAKKARGDDGHSASSKEVFLQSVHLLSRAASVTSIIESPANLPLRPLLTPPERLAITLGPSVGICKCSSELSMDAKRRGSVMKTTGSVRQLCRKKTEEHAEYELLLEMSRKFAEERNNRGVAEECDAFSACKRKNLTSFILGAKARVQGFLSVHSAYETDIPLNVPGLGASIELKAKRLPRILPHIIQVFVEPAHRRRGVACEALRQFLDKQEAVVVRNPEKIMCRTMTKLGFVLVGASQIKLDAHALYVRELQQ